MMISQSVAPTASPTPYRQGIFTVVAFSLGASLPTSTALMNITLALVVVCLLWQRDRQHLGKLVKQPLVWLPALMFTLLACSLLTQPHDYGPTMVGKYQKLLYVLPLALFFLADRKLAARFVSGFLWANALILFISLATGLEHITLGKLNPQDPTVFKLHITQNVFMALATLVWLTRAHAGTGRQRWGYAALVVLASANVLLMVQGRTGYVALGIGTSVWLLLTLKRQTRLWGGCAGLLVLTLLVLIPNRAFEHMQTGVQEINQCVTASGAQAYQVCNTSMGQRTEFIHDALHHIRQAPWFGHGAGSFRHVNLYNGQRVNNPHNEYLLETVQSGLLGLAVFLTWMGFCYRAAWHLPVGRRNLVVAVLSSYMACHLFNSFLLDSSEGHLFVIIAALLAGVAVNRPVQHQPIAHRD